MAYQPQALQIVPSENLYRPTFFELYAADKLSSSLKSALTYSLAVIGERRPWAAALLELEDELFAALSWALESQSLNTAEASFAEGLYGLKRIPNSRAGASNSSPEGRALTPLQRKVSTLVLVYLPYFRAKLDRMYSELRDRVAVEDETLGAAGPAAAPGSTENGVGSAWGGEGGGGGAGEDGEEEGQRSRSGRDASTSMPSSSASVSTGRVGGLRSRAATSARHLWGALTAACRRAGRLTPERAFVAIYPWAHCLWEGCRFAYQLAYLLERTDYFSPELHVLGLVVSRLTASDVRRLDAEGDARRVRGIRRFQEGWWFLPRALASGMARAAMAVGENVRAALIFAVFGFKMVEWWYTAGEEKLGMHKPLPPPPPPPAPPPHRLGLPLPRDPRLCPLCLTPRSNPTLLTTSGYLFCYRCICEHLQEHGCCPVTRFPASMESIRRVYVE